MDLLADADYVRPQMERPFDGSAKG